jgi:hypothetical protein
VGDEHVAETLGVSPLPASGRCPREPDPALGAGPASL